MANILSFFSKKKSAPAIQKLTKKLDPHQLPPMSAPELIKHLELDNQIRAIKRLSSVNEQYWKTLYQQSIYNAADLIQLIPASGSHHHAGPGGLLSHTIEVCANSMRIAKAYQLPQGVGPEERARLDQVWRFGVFSAALLHDIGKTLALVQITVTNKEGRTSSWSPYLGKMPSSTHSYQITFQPADYHLHHQLSISLMDILPRQARHWLLLDKRLIKQLMAWLMSDPYECGVIGEIVRQADMESTAADLKLGGHKVRFPGAYQLPMIDRLMTALRHLLKDGALKLNRNGAAGWIYQGKAYLVCRTVANAVQSYLQENGATDIPTEPTRLYDTWQEHGYAQENPDGGAIWKIAINGEDYQLNLTVMIFTASQLFKVGHTPKEMKGTIEILSQDTNIKILPQSSSTQPSHDTNSANTAESTGSDTANQSSLSINQADPFDLSNEQSSESNKTQQREAVTTQDALEISPEPGELYTPNEHKTETANLSESNNEHTEAKSNNRELAQTTLVQSSNSGAVPLDKTSIPEPIEREVGEYFIAWVRRSVRDKSLKVNQVKAQVHVIAQGVILISPVIIKKFCTKMGYDEMTSGKPTWKIVQAHFHKCKLHIKTENHVNIHKFQVKGPNRSTFLNGYLLSFEVIYPEGKHPEFNKVITHVG